jgi:hypothetical protein
MVNGALAADGWGSSWSENAKGRRVWNPAASEEVI